MKNLEDFLNPDTHEDDDEEEEDDDQPSSKKSKIFKIKAGKDLLELFNKPESGEEESTDEDTDKTPELDSEAPLEYLSKVEEIAISQALAEERLHEVQAEIAQADNEEVKSALDFLEAVASTGYIEEEYQAITSEIGINEDVYEPLNRSFSYSDLAESIAQTPNDPPKATARSARQVIQREVAKADHPEKRTKDKVKETAGIVNYLMSRRKARLKNQASAPIVEKDLSQAVDHLRDKLESREVQIRQIVETKENQPDLSQVITPEEIRKSPSHGELDKIIPKEVMEPVQAEITAQTITRNELLKIASSIEIEGTKLSTIYQNNLLGEKGLRRVVAEYLRGGNVKKVLRREMIEREIDFERDPILRDRGDRSTVSPAPTTVDSLLEKSGINWNEDQHTVMPTKPKKPLLPKPKPSTKRQTNKMYDVLFVLGLLILFIVLIVVVINR